MIPYKSPLLTSVPQTLQKRLEIMQAVRTLAGPDAEGQLRRRQAEIACLRRELKEIAQDLRQLCREWPLLIRSNLRKYGYNPEEPRVPKHHTGGGEWTSEGGSESSGAGDATIILAARRNQAECDEQYKLDIFKCNLVHTPLCYASAMERYAACLAGRSIPQLRF
ncbi:MAG: hypothetical protein ABSD08_14685 [Xanthobacteraceae bacterium]|jgi:hypothetical protein